MANVVQPWHLIVWFLASWINREQAEVIDYLRSENQVLKEKLGPRRILLTDDQRRRLAVKGKVLGRRRMEEIGTLFTPDTILRWHRMLVAQKWDYSAKRGQSGRPLIDAEIVELIVKLARENPSWGYDRIQGAVANLGHQVSDQTVGNVLKDHGIEPAPRRKSQPSWGTFLKSHWDVLSAVDFATVEVWTVSGLVTFYLLVVMELKSRRVCLAGCTANPHEAWMKQTAKELTNAEDGFLNGDGKKYLIMDRDDKFCESFRRVLQDENVQPVRLPPRSPNLNAHLERFFGSLRSECLDRMIFFGEQSLRTAVREYLSHYHGERNHQGLNNKIPIPDADLNQTTGPIDCRQRLGGLLRYYHRRTA